MREPLGVFGLALVLLVIFGAVFADFLTQWDPTRINPRIRFEGPSGEHLLGTDQLGRDLFTLFPYATSLRVFCMAGASRFMWRSSRLRSRWSSGSCWV